MTEICNLVVPEIENNHDDGPRRNLTWERYRFFSRKQKEDETLEAFVSALTDLSFQCELGLLRDAIVKDIMLCGLAEAYKTVQETLLLKDPTSIEEALCYAKMQEEYDAGVAITEECSFDRKESLLPLEDDQEKSCCPNSPALQSGKYSFENKPPVNEKAAAVEKRQPFKCQACALSFHDNRALRLHRKTHIGRYICKICGKALKKMNSLNRHMQSHSGERPFMCAECGKCFIRKGALDAHLSTHNKVRPYVCNYCNKAFVNKLYLFVHIRIHTGDKPYQCQFCGKCFAQKSTFNVHLRTNHTKETPYRCAHCEKAFVYKRELDDHTFSHTGDAPFLCPECGKPFTRQSYLNIHRKVHSEERPHKCSDCEKSFKSKKHLNRHSSMHCDKNRASRDETMTYKIK